MSFQLSPIGNDQFLDVNGNPLAGGKIFTYLTGTTTKVATYTDNTGGANQTNPIILNSSGFPTIPIYISTAVVYKFVLAPANDTDPPSSPMYTWNDVQVFDSTSVSVSQWVSGTAPTYISANSFSLVGDQTSVYHVGRRVKLQSTIGLFYGTITSSSFGAVTTVSVVLDAGVLDATLNAGWYGVLEAVGSAIPGSSISGTTTILTGADARTNTVATPLEIRANTSGTPAAGIGTGVLFKAQSADEIPSSFGQVEFVASDVAAGSEDTYFQVLLRVAGAALTACYRFVATGAFKAIFTHANTADRTYILPNYDGALATLAGTETLANKTMSSPTINSPTITGNTVGTPAMKTAEGSTSGFDNNTLAVTMNDYSFFPQMWDNGTSIGDGLQPAGAADNGSTVGRFTIAISGGTGAATHGARWRYITASDNPVMWVAYDPITGKIVATWASDDPTPGDVPGVEVVGMTSIKLTAKDLESFTELSTKASDAQDYIRDRKLKPIHQAYRALQLYTQDNAPSRWLMDNCHIDLISSKMYVKKGR